MGKERFYHGTDKLLDIVEKGLVLCPALVGTQKDSFREKLWTSYKSDYLKAVKAYADLIRKKVQEGQYKNCFDEEYFKNCKSDEEFTLINLPLYSEEVSIFQDFKESQRISHVFLGDFNLARSYINFGNGSIKSVMGFDIPSELVKKLGGFVLVEKEVPLQFMSELYVQSHLISVAEEHIQSKGYKNVNVKELR